MYMLVTFLSVNCLFKKVCSTVPILFPIIIMFLYSLFKFIFINSEVSFKRISNSSGRESSLRDIWNPYSTSNIS